MMHPTIFIIDRDSISARETAKAITDSGHYKSYAIAKNGIDTINYLNGLDGHHHFPHMFFVDEQTLLQENYFFMKEFERLFSRYAALVRIIVLKDNNYTNTRFGTGVFPIEEEVKPLTLKTYTMLIKGYELVE